MNEIIIIMTSLLQSSSESYAEDVLERLACVAAIGVKLENEFDKTYTINLTDATISNIDSESDQPFILFVAYKAVIDLMKAELRTATKQSVKIVDGPSTIDLSSVAKNYTDLIDSLEKQYDTMKKDYVISRNGEGSFGYAVITPTTVGYISTNDYT